MIEKKETHPPVIGIPKGVINISVSNIGLNMPMKKTKGDIRRTFLKMAFNGISPAVIRKTG
jgi:hypothetical protein